MKKFFQDFKKFISRGNVVDMAVGVIVGSAFSAIVTSLTNKIIMPLINWVLSLGGENGLEKAYTFLKKVYDTSGELDLTKSIYIDWGAFITAIINFFLIAFVLFTILRAVMKANALIKDVVAEESNKEIKAEKKAVRMEAKANGKKFKTAWAEHLAIKQRIAEEKAKALADEETKKKAEEEEIARLNSSEYLLKEILGLLKTQQPAKANKLPKSTKAKQILASKDEESVEIK